MPRLQIEFQISLKFKEIEINILPEFYALKYLEIVVFELRKKEEMKKKLPQTWQKMEF